MIWLLGAVWGWLVLAALLGAAVTAVWSLRKVTVSTIRVGTLEVPDDPAPGPVDLD
ncbi:MAG: hypothetical protein U0R78_16360 [Nocardioidaceae bacterium]